MLDALKDYFDRPGTKPTEQDYTEAGLLLEGGSVVTPTGRLVGMESEFRITTACWDKTTQRTLNGRFLVQDSDLEGEVMHFQYRGNE